MILIVFLGRLIKTFPCVAAFMSSLTIVGVALDRLSKKLLTTRIRTSIFSYSLEQDFSKYYYIFQPKILKFSDFDVLYSLKNLR